MTDVRLANFAFSTSQQYLCVFVDGALGIYRNNVAVYSLSTTYSAAELHELNFTQSLDTMIICHENHPPAALRRQGADNAWTLGDIVFSNYPTFRYNTDHSNRLTPSGTSGSITCTLDKPYWLAGHVGTVLNVNNAIVRIDTLVSDQVVNATVIDWPLESGDPDRAWQEQAWSAVHGWPRCSTFYQNRFVIGGTRDAPNTIFASNTGDYFNFIWATLVESVPTVQDNNGYVFTVSNDNQIYIRNLFGMDDLIIFSNQSEFRMSGGYQTAVTPKNVFITAQSNYGCAAIPVFLVDMQVIYATANLKEIRGISYDYLHQRYQSQNYTITAHQIFTQDHYPTSMAFLRSYSDTQSNYVFVARSDGQMAVMTIDVAKEVQGWARFTSQGSIVACCVVGTANAQGFVKDTLYVAVDRQNGLFIEALTDPMDAPVFCDSWQHGTSDIPKTHWSGLTNLIGQQIQVVGDGTVQEPVSVQGDGSIDLQFPVSDIYVGLGYTSSMETMPLSPVVDGMQKRGVRMRKVRSYVTVHDTGQLNIDGYDVPIRELSGGVLNTPLPNYTGTIHQSLGGPNDPISTDPTIILSVNAPVPATILGINTDLEVKDER